MGDGAVQHCYPQGRFDAAVKRQLATRVAFASAMIGDTSGIETVPPANRYAIRSYTLNICSNVCRACARSSTASPGTVD